MKESTIEKYLIGQVKSIGGLTIKQTGTRGVPDRLVLYRGEAIFCEVKQSKGVLAKHQMRFAEKLADCGVETVVIWSKEGVDLFIEDVLQFHAQIELAIADVENEAVH